MIARERNKNGRKRQWVDEVGWKEDSEGKKREDEPVGGRCETEGQ